MIQKEEQSYEQQQQELTEKTKRRRKILKRIIRNNRQAASDKQFDILMNLDKDLFAGYNHYRLGNFCIQQNRLQLAEQNLNRAKELIKNKFLFTNVYFSLSNLQLKRKNKQKACFYFNIVIEKSPHKNSKDYLNKDQVIFAGKLNAFNSFLDSHKNLIKLNVEMQQYEKGYEICKAATELKQLQQSSIIEFKNILNELTGNYELALNFARKKLIEELNKKQSHDFQPLDIIKINPINPSENQQKKQKKISVITVKWGLKYSADCVNRLFKSIIKNTQWDVDFYCLTDDHYGIDKKIKVKPLKDKWKKQWGKTVIFNLQIEGKKIYFDLDVLITGSLDKIFQYQGQFGLLRHNINSLDEYSFAGYDTTVMIWQGSKFKQIYNKISAVFPLVQRKLIKFNYWFDLMVQDADDLNTLNPRAIVAFDPQRHKEQPPLDSFIVYFPDRIKMEQFPAKWIKQLCTS